MKQMKSFFCMLLAALLLSTAVSAQTKTVTSTFTDMTGPYNHEGDWESTGDFTTSDGKDWGYVTSMFARISKTSSGSFALTLNGESITLSSAFEMVGYVKKITVRVGGNVKKIDFAIGESRSDYEVGSLNVTPNILMNYSYGVASWAGDNSYVKYLSNLNYSRRVFVTITPNDATAPTIIESISVEYLQELADDGKSGAIGQDMIWKLELLDNERLPVNDKFYPHFNLTISGSGNMRDFKVESNPSTGSFSNAPWSKHLGISKVVVSEGIGSVGDNAFYHLPYLWDLTLPTTSLWSIGNSSFSVDTNFRNLTLPEGLSQIGEEAFYTCNLESVHIPSTVRIIGRQAFACCAELKSITVAEGNETYSSPNNCNAIIKTADKELVQGCKTTVIPNDIVTIAPYAFYHCDDLESISIPATVTRIGTEAFHFCEKLKNIVLFDNVQLIEPWAFYYCSSVETMTIGSGVTLIGKGAFNNMKSLKNVYCTADPSKLTWEYNSDETCCNPDGSTKFHVADPDAWKAKFPDAHVQFVAIGSAETKDGDVSGDGKTDDKDVTALMGYLMGSAPESFNPEAADVNKDGKVNVADIVALINLILNK